MRFHEFRKKYPLFFTKGYEEWLQIEAPQKGHARPKFRARVRNAEGEFEDIELDLTEYQAALWERFMKGQHYKRP